MTLSSCRIADCKNHGALFVGPTARGAMHNAGREKSLQPPAAAHEMRPPCVWVLAARVARLRWQAPAAQ